MVRHRSAILVGGLVILCCHVIATQGAIYSSGGGPVYVNPNDPVEAVEANVEKKESRVEEEDFVTQTVYGFLDFTTTIGNTVMVFSPQSAAPESSSTTLEKVKKTISPVIKEQPLETSREDKRNEIKPTLSSVVQVIATTTSPQIVSSIVTVIEPKVEVITEKNVELKDKVVSKKVTVKVEKKEEKPVEEEPEEEEPEEEPEEDEPEEEEEEVEEEHEDLSPIQSSIVEISSSESTIEPVLQIANNLGEPEYDFLSRQPSEYVEETYKVVNLKGPNTKFPSKPPKRVQSTAKRDDIHPTGLVTKLGGTVVKDGSTTVHETSVIGTYISGKYAQVLQSTSHIFHNKPKIAPTQPLRILKTAAPSIPKSRFNSEPYPQDDQASLPVDSLFANSASPAPRTSRKPAQNAGSFKNNRFRGRNSKETPDYNDEDFKSVETKKRPRPTKKRYGRPGNPKSTELSTVSDFSDSSTPAYQNRRTKNRAYKPKVQPSNVDQDQQTTSLYKFKLNRTPGRWQYKSAPKPRVTIRKNGENDGKDEKLPQINEKPVDEPLQKYDEIELASSPSINGDVFNQEDENGNRIEKPPPVETLKVEISTPADFSDTYYEIATIKSPYTFQVGTVKNTRFITVTSTFEKLLEPEPASTLLTEPLTENILATTTHLDKEHNLLETTIATLPPLYLNNVETPALETVVETFSTNHEVLKTHILPIIMNGNTTESHTLIQTYHVTRLVTATKTLPPMELYQFVPSKRLNEFNSRLDEAGSELHLELEFGDNNDEDEEDDEDQPPRRELPPEFDLSNIGAELDLVGVDQKNLPQRPKKKATQKLTTTTQAPMTPTLSPELQQQLALLRLLNPGAQLPQIVSKPVIKLETIYETHSIPIFNGVSTTFSTISRPVSTTTRTEYELETASLPIPPIQQLNPLFPQQQQIQLATTPVVTNTMVTQTNSKVLKLTFGAKTAYTTLYSTQVVPTLLTTYITNSVPIQHTAAFPGYFPAPYAPFPFVG